MEVPSYLLFGLEESASTSWRQSLHQSHGIGSHHFDIRRMGCAECVAIERSDGKPGFKSQRFNEAGIDLRFGKNCGYPQRAQQPNEVCHFTWRRLPFWVRYN